MQIQSITIAADDEDVRAAATSLARGFAIDKDVALVALMAWLNESIVRILDDPNWYADNPSSSLRSEWQDQQREAERQKAQLLGPWLPHPAAAPAPDLPSTAAAEPTELPPSAPQIIEPARAFCSLCSSPVLPGHELCGLCASGVPLI